MIYIIYHKDCMDGLSAAFVTRCSLREMSDSHIEAIPMHYNEVETVWDLPSLEDSTIYIVDFSLPIDMLVKLSTIAHKIIMLDHHKTAEGHIDALKTNSDIDIIFDNNKSGAMIAFDYFREINCNPLEPELFEIISDRDLWKFELSWTKEISEYLFVNVEKNNLESFSDVYFEFQQYKHNMIQAGSEILKTKTKQVSEKVDKCFDIKINKIDFKCINATENISELGNAISRKYDKPVCVFFFISNEDVVLSFRSQTHLADVSEIAKIFLGGGHRNASGATITSYHLRKLLDNFYDEI